MKRIRALKASLKARVSKLRAPETIFTASIASIGIGIAFIYWPAAFIAVGLLAAFFTYIYVRHEI